MTYLKEIYKYSISEEMMHLKIKEKLISILLLASLCGCFKNDATATLDASKIIKVRPRDNSLDLSKNNTSFKTATTHLTTYQIPKALTTHNDSVITVDQRKSKGKNQHNPIPARSPKNLLKDATLSSTSRQSRSSGGRRRIKTNAEQKSQMKFPEGFHPPIAPFNPLLYPFATATPSTALQVNEPWKPIKFTEASAQKHLETTMNEDSLSPTQLSSLRESIIYGLPKPNSQESFEQEADFGTDTHVVKPLNLISRMDSSVTSGDEKFESLLPPGKDKIDSLMTSNERTIELISTSKAKEMEEDKSDLRNTKEISHMEDLNKSRTESWFSTESRQPLPIDLAPASAEFNDNYRKLNQTTWPPSSSEEKIIDDSSVLIMPKNNTEIDYTSIDFQKTDLLKNSVEDTVSHYVAKLSKPFIGHNTKSEPTICIPLHFREASSTDSDELVDIERVYCFPFPPELKMNFNGANIPASVRIEQHEWLNNELISSNANRVTMTLLLTSCMVLMVTKILQRLW